MIEKNCNIFDMIGKADYLAITTNGIIKNNGDGVCGAGLALAAKKYIPNIEQILGWNLTKNGNIPCLLGEYGGTKFISFPTKHHFKNNSDIELIKQSAKLIRNFEGKVAISRPGCSLGGLNYDVVKPIIADIFPEDRFIICHKE